MQAAPLTPAFATSIPGMGPLLVGVRLRLDYLHNSFRRIICGHVHQRGEFLRSPIPRPTGSIEE